MQLVSIRTMKLQFVQRVHKKVERKRGGRLTPGGGNIGACILSFSPVACDGTRAARGTAKLGGAA